MIVVFRGKHWIGELKILCEEKKRSEIRIYLVKCLYVR